MNRTVIALLLVGIIAGQATGDDAFDRVRVLGSSVAQAQSTSNGAVTGGLGFSGERGRHWIYALANFGVSTQSLDSQPADAYGSFLLSPPSEGAGFTVRYRYFLSNEAFTLGGYGQMDGAFSSYSAEVDGTIDTKKAFLFAVSGGGASRVLVSAEQNLALVATLGFAFRALGGDAARDRALLMATQRTETTRFYGGELSILIQTGDLFAGLQLSIFSGDIDSLAGFQAIPLVGVRGGFDLKSKPAVTSTGSPEPPQDPVPVL